MLSAADQTLAVALVGDTPDGALTAIVGTIAAQYSFDAMYPGFGLELLYCQRDLIKVALGKARQQYAVKTFDQSSSYQQPADRLAAMLDGCQLDIATRLDQARASIAGVSVGQMTKTAPITPPLPPPFPDANSPVLHGSPYTRSWKPQS